MVWSELDRIREAIRRGLLSDLTHEMLQEARVGDLRRQLEAPPLAQLHVLQLLPDAIQRRLDHLDRVLRTDVDAARASL